MTNDELMEAAATGDQAAFGTLVERHGGRLVGWISARVGSDPSLDADDVAQEVWLRVIRGAGGYQPQGQFVAWLYRMARNILMDAAKVRRRSALGHVEANGDDWSQLDVVATDDEAVTDVVDRRDVLRQIEGVLEYLDAEQVEVLRGVAEGESLSEVAARMGALLPTTKGRWRIVKEKIRRRLVKCEA